MHVLKVDMDTRVHFRIMHELQAKLCDSHADSS